MGWCVCQTLVSSDMSQIYLLIWYIYRAAKNTHTLLRASTCNRSRTVGSLLSIPDLGITNVTHYNQI